MTRLLFAATLFPAVLFAVTPVTPPQLQTLWSAADGLQAPESAYLEPTSQRIFVSNVVGSPGEKDGNGWIGVVDPSVRTPTITPFAKGLNAPKGLRAHGEWLWVTDIDRLVAFDLKSAAQAKEIPIAGAQFLNDIAITSDGTLFVSDTLGSRIYRITGDKAEVFVEGKEWQSPNGLWTDGKDLYVAAWGFITDPATFGAKKKGGLYKVSLKTRKRTAVGKSGIGHLDGLESDGKGGFFTTDWVAGTVLHITAKGRVATLHQGLKNAADLGLTAEALLVPDMGDNKIFALRRP